MTRRFTTVIAALLGIAVGGCREPATRQPPRSALEKPAMPRTDTVDVTGPAVLAFFATTQTAVDANVELGEALSDFQYALPGIRRGLKEHGVALAVSYADTVVLRIGGRSERFVTRGPKGGVGYRFFGPNQPAVTLSDGVMTNRDLLDEAGRYYGW